MLPPMSVPTAPRLITFDTPAEIFATDSAGGFDYHLTAEAAETIDTEGFDEMRFVFSIWHPSTEKHIDLDRAYLEIRAAFDSDKEHWTRLAEVEPVVPAYNAGDRFDGWIVLPVLATRCGFSLSGRGFQPRSRVQLRASVYLVA